ncbi:MAG: hypothetical protein KGH58_04280, partial [Candidatus Micrarchaeota archaeon]|nr:hypothetical protein [Candidatus Micrarchaeota archaeon]
MNLLLIAGIIVVIVAILGAALYITSNSQYAAASSTTTQPVSLPASIPTSTTTPSTAPTSSTTVSQSPQANSTLPVQSATDFIVSNPLNLSQISQISKFRSCLGHDYSGYDLQGYNETQRSMKHYFTPVQQLKGSVGRLQEYAPFNGTIESITEEHTPVGKQVWVGYTSGSSPQPGVWYLVFFHMDPLPGIAV